jgi:hypothetical protein
MKCSGFGSSQSTRCWILPIVWVLQFDVSKNHRSFPQLGFGKGEDVGRTNLVPIKKHGAIARRSALVETVSNQALRSLAK